jgi:hypothetical protein
MEYFFSAYLAVTDESFDLYRPVTQKLLSFPLLDFR